MKIVMVLTSHDILGNTGHKTGFWLEEFAAPNFTSLDAGVELTLCSPKAGQPPIDHRRPRADRTEPGIFNRRRESASEADGAFRRVTDHG
jgi:putative intracellular protease/amidase